MLHLLKIVGIGVLLTLAGCNGGRASLQCPKGSSSKLALAASSTPLTLSKADYLDKTLAGIVGEVGGFLTGYEFAAPNAQPLPDTWFDPANGPYAGNFANFLPGGNTNDYIRYLGPGRVRGQDNYFMDFFNQLILKEHGILPSNQAIRSEYLNHQISDYGGSGVGSKLMVLANMQPFQTGQHEFNDSAWCCEPYIETDTLGFIAPGMPRTAQTLAKHFAEVSGTFDTTTWSRFMATLMSVAYFETDATVALSKAAAALPANSWPYQMYQKALTLQAQNATDWRAAQAQIIAYRRFLYGSDDDRVIADINQATVILSILYGNNDYTQTLKIAAIGGNEGADNATGIGGFMGVIKGMAGLPQPFLDKIYANGTGVFVNDTSGVLQTYVAANYPATQTWTSLRDLYRSNFEAQLTAAGGTIGADSYSIPGQEVPVPVVIAMDNADFEAGTLSGWTASPADHAKAETQTGTYSPYATYTLSHSGAYKGTIWTDSNATTDTTLSRTVTGLTVGARYLARGYTSSMATADARLYIVNGSTTLQASAYSTEDMTPMSMLVKGRGFAQRNIEFVASDTSITLGYLVHTPGAWSAIDDVTIEQITNPTTVRIEAESATLAGGASAVANASASGGKVVTGLGQMGGSLQFTVMAAAAGEYRFAVAYANNAPPEMYNLYGADTWALPASLSLYVNGVSAGKVFFTRSAAGLFSANIVGIPVDLTAGSNSIQLVRESGAGSIDIDYGELGTLPESVFVGDPGAGPGAPAGSTGGTGTSSTTGAGGTTPECE